MFDRNSRYETSGINENLDLKYRILLWKLIEELGDCPDLDSFQIFRFEERRDADGNIIRVVTHIQENTGYSKEYILELSDDFIEGTVYVIDDGECSIMLWSDEY